LAFEKTGVRLYSTAGIHPHEAGRALQDHSARGGWRAELESIIASAPNHIVAVGECGLDFDRNFSSHADQIAVFQGQLEVACALNRPVFLHNRDAHDEFVAVLKKFVPKGLRGVVHCHTDPDPGHLRELLDLGMDIGITGWVCDPGRGRGEPVFFVDEDGSGFIVVF
jgi:TatD DNase family protein